MADVNKMGPNRTGIDMSPVDSQRMMEGARNMTETTAPQEGVIDFRKAVAEDRGVVGSVPVPLSFKGVLSAGKEKLKGHSPEVLINKLGQRLAFERAGTRLYDALISKCSTAMDPAAGKIVSLDRLRQFRDEEHQHALMLKTIMTDVGADPTAMTPDADVSAVASMGLPKVIAEPRTSVLQCLEAIQIAELADNVAWVDLQALCLNMGLEDIAESFKTPISQESVHEEVITDWIRQLLLQKSLH